MNRINIKTIQYFSFALLSGLLLGSCSQDDSASEVSTKALEIHASLAEAQTGVSVRSTSTLTSGSLGVFLSDANDYTARDNVQYTYADGSWSSAAPVYLGVNSATACAYYPYDASLTDASSVALTSQVYASGKDFCYALNNGALSMSSPSWSMRLEHAYSEVTLNITRDASYLGICAISKVSLINSLLNVSGSLDITGGVYSDLVKGNMSYDPGIASLSSGSSTSSSVLLVPVSGMNGTLSVALMVDGKTMVANIDAFSAGLSTLEAGVNYTIDLSVKGDEISISDVSVSDWESVVVSDSQLLENIASASNSYIVSPGGSVNIPVSRANASDLGAQLSDVTTGWSSEVLWRDNSGLTITLDDGLQAVGAFTVKATNPSATGNAVVVIKDGSGTILWSWQIWVTDYDPSSENETYNGYTLMDRNLGATSDVAGSVDALGLLYQWGRKDPFAGSSAIASGTITLKTLYAGASGSTVYVSTNTEAPTTSANNLATSVRNPGVFYYGTVASYDWYIGSNATQNDALWDATSKTVYDPCPSGWRVAPQAAFNTWFTSTTTWDSTNLGCSIIDVSGSWYPAVGRRLSTTGLLNNVSTSGYYWTAMISGQYAFNMLFSSTAAGGTYVSNRAHSFGVRCVQEN